MPLHATTNLHSPGPIGDVTASTGAFSSISASARITASNDIFLTGYTVLKGFTVNAKNTLGVGFGNNADSSYIGGDYMFTSNGGAASDTGLERSAAAVVKASDGAGGFGNVVAGNALTAGTMTVGANAYVRSHISKFTWTNAMVVALGAATTGDITVCTLPAKTVVKNAYVVIDSTAAGVTTLTVAVGRVSAGYIDYIVASDAKVAANTVYGDGSAERGTNLTGYDMGSYTATVAVKAHFISTVENLDQTTTCTGTVYLETITLP